MRTHGSGEEKAKNKKTNITKATKSIVPTKTNSSLLYPRSDSKPVSAKVFATSPKIPNGASLMINFTILVIPVETSKNTFC